MATARNAKISASEHLDELDLLMQRMLALPVEPRVDSDNEHHEEAATQGLHFDHPDTGEHVEKTDSLTEQHLAHHPPPPVPTPAPVLTPVAQANAEPAADGGVMVQNVHLPKEDELGQSTAAQKAISRAVATVGAAPVPLLLRPIILVNRIFDRIAASLGPPGRWARDSQGRSVLGWVGLALIVIAAIWVLLDAMGWY